MKIIKFNSPYITNHEAFHLKNTLKKRYFDSRGFYSEKCKAYVSKLVNSKNILLTNSCTGALEIACLSLKLKENDEVIIPSYTFVSAADVFLKNKAKIKFCDIDDNYVMDLNDLQLKISSKTKVIVVVHYNGNSVDFEKLKKIIGNKKIYVIEDAAQAIGAKYKNFFLGSLGDFGCFSFHNTKNIHCGFGGALVVNNQKFMKNALTIWNRGTNRHEFIKKKTSKYTWVTKGTSTQLSELQSGFLYPQLQNLNKNLKLRKKIYFRYLKNLESGKNNYDLPKLNSFNKSNYHIFYLVLKKKNIRTKLINFMKKFKIELVSHYEPLHQSIAAKKFIGPVIKLKKSEDLPKRIVRLPLHHEITVNDINFVCKKIKIFFKKLSN
jgi:dTDP-4-amino-4,6-dideoxygalactose transaminase